MSRGPFAVFVACVCLAGCVSMPDSADKKSARSSAPLFGSVAPTETLRRTPEITADQVHAENTNLAVQSLWNEMSQGRD